MLGALKGQLAPAIALAEDKELRQSLRIVDERTGTIPRRTGALWFQAQSLASRLRV